MRHHLMFLLLAGCATQVPAGAPADTGPADTDQPDEPKTELIADADVKGARDSMRSPTPQGALVFGTPAIAELTREQAHHAWTFELTASAQVALYTAEAGSGEVDTVLYIYREGPNGWGRYTARNDDSNGTLFSSLSRRLVAGRYRVLVKAYDQRVRGAFQLHGDCSGDGCPRAMSCLFGERFGDLGQGIAQVSNTEMLTQLDPSDTLARQQVILAVQQSAHTDVRTAEEAFARVDGQTIRRLWLYDPAGARSFTAYEYGAGDSSYGAIFVQGATAIVSRIQDGDLMDCRVEAQSCVLGRSFHELLDRLEIAEDVRLTDVSGFDASQRAQLIDAVSVAYEASTVEEALAAIDSGEIRYLRGIDPASRREYRVYEYGAGGNSYGAAYEAASSVRAVEIHDGDFYACSALGPLVRVADGGDCDAGLICEEGSRCVGIADESGLGRCRPIAPIAGEGEACRASDACGAGLLCAGLTRGPEGLCVPEWMSASIEEAGPFAIPDNNASGLIRARELRGLASVDTDVSVRATIRHGRPADVRVTLQNPIGTELVLFDGATTSAAGVIEIDAAAGFSGDEPVNGTWVLRIVDRRRGTAGTLERWSLSVVSRWD